MPLDLQVIHASASALPLPTLVALAGTFVVVVALFARVFPNAFRGNSPPIDEGIPFVGGILKFSKVCGCVREINSGHDGF